MGITIHFQTDSGAECPFWFTRTDSKPFYHIVIGHIWGTADPPDDVGTILQHFGLDLTPLGKVAGEAWELEDYLAWYHDIDREEVIQQWQKDMARDEEMWQSPAQLIACLRPLVAALQAQPHVFETLGITRTYFVDGYFEQDLRDVLAMAEWAEQAGVQRVRFQAA